MLFDVADKFFNVRRYPGDKLLVVLLLYSVLPHHLARDPFIVFTAQAHAVVAAQRALNGLCRRLHCYKRRLVGVLLHQLVKSDPTFVVRRHLALDHFTDSPPRFGVDLVKRMGFLVIAPKLVLVKVIYRVVLAVSHAITASTVSLQLPRLGQYPLYLGPDFRKARHSLNIDKDIVRVLHYLINSVVI